MTKILNLDALAAPTKTLTIGGVSYEVVGMTVENFIETTREAEKLGEQASTSAQLEATMAMIRRAIPSIPREILDRLSLEQLGLITQFVRGDIDGTPAAAQAPDEGSVPNG